VNFDRRFWDRPRRLCREKAQRPQENRVLHCNGQDPRIFGLVLQPFVSFVGASHFPAALPRPVEPSGSRAGGEPPASPRFVSRPIPLPRFLCPSSMTGLPLPSFPCTGPSPTIPPGVRTRVGGGVAHGQARGSRDELTGRIGQRNAGKGMTLAGALPSPLQEIETRRSFISFCGFFVSAMPRRGICASSRLLHPWPNLAGFPADLPPCQ